MYPGGRGRGYFNQNNNPHMMNGSMNQGYNMMNVNRGRGQWIPKMSGYVPHVGYGQNLNPMGNQRFDGFAPYGNMRRTGYFGEDVNDLRSNMGRGYGMNGGYNNMPPMLPQQQQHPMFNPSVSMYHSQQQQQGNGGFGYGMGGFNNKPPMVQQGGNSSMSGSNGTDQVAKGMCNLFIWQSSLCYFPWETR